MYRKSQCLTELHILQRLEHIKLQLRQQSGGQMSVEEPPEESLQLQALSPEQAVSVP